MAGELAMLRVAMSSTMESVLGSSPSDTFHVEVVAELAAEFQKLVERHSWIERPATRICNLLLGPPPSRGRLAGRLDEATRQLREELVAQWEADTKPEALWILAT
jgi:hypothetical protein